jgi:predicted anti-sigma-YlaC factor YlaD
MSLLRRFRLRRKQPSPGPGGLACQELVELVTDYLEGALAPEDRRRFEEHIGRCVGCTNYLDQMRVTIALSGRLSEDTFPDGARDELVAAFRSWKQV